MFFIYHDKPPMASIAGLIHLNKLVTDLLTFPQTVKLKNKLFSPKSREFVIMDDIEGCK